MTRVPPWWIRAWFRLLPDGEREAVRDDLVELYEERRRRLGTGRARLWLWWQTVRCVVAMRGDGIRTGGVMRGIWLDLRHVVRGLRASRAFTAVAVLSLAIGIGANAAIFSVIRTLLLDDIVAPAPDQLSLVAWHVPDQVRISQINSSGGTDAATGLSLRSNFSYPLARALMADAPAGVEVFGFNFLRDLTVAVDGASATLAGGLAADAGYFRVLAPRLEMGRALLEEDDRPDAPPVVVLSHGFFMRVFGGDRSTLGRVVRLNGVSVQVVGVTAREFRGLSKGGFFPQTEVTVPLSLVPQLQPSWAPAGTLLSSDRHFWVRLMARFAQPDQRAGTEARWAALMAPYLASVTGTATGVTTPRVLLQPGRRGLDQTRPETRRLLYILMGVVGAVLLIACVNLASLMLARGASRQRELTVRRALGAGRWRLIRAQLVEAAVLAGAGGAAGLLLTFWARAILTNVLTAGLGTAPMSRQPLEVSVDGWLMAGTLGLSAIVAMLVSVLPAWRLTGDQSHDVKHQVVGAAGPKMTLGRALVAVQVATTVPLLVCAALFLRTVANLGAIDVGFQPEGLAYFKVNPATMAADLPAQSAVYQRVIEGVRRVPGVLSATLIENALLSGITSNTGLAIDGVRRDVYINAIGPDFLDTVGLQLVAGRMPGVQDGPGRPLVGVINDTAAREWFGQRSPLGQRLPFSTPIEVIGVVSDALYDRPRAPVRATVYPSALQRPGFNGHHVLVRFAGPMGSLEPQLRRAVAEVSRDLAVPEVKTQVAQMRELTMRERVFAQLLTLFGGFAVLLACIGLHGVTAYAVVRRTNEIGVRMALGATRGQVLWLILRQVAWLAALGLAVGVPLSLWITPLFGALLFQVSPSDPVVLAIGALIMLLVALGAGWLPARRAAQLDPLRALRSE